MKFCESCGKEHDGTYGSGRFCCLACSKRRVIHQHDIVKRIETININKDKQVEEYLSNPNLCLNCNCPILINDGDQLCKIKLKKFCNKSCAAAYNNTKRGFISKKQVLKKCKNCDNPVLTNSAIYCSIECNNEYEYNDRINRYLNGLWDGSTKSGEISCTIERYIHDINENKCQDCGWNEQNLFTKKYPLEIHHIDGNSKNNLLTNLKLICPNCHSLTENYKGANIGNGRFNRRERYISNQSY